MRVAASVLSLWPEFSSLTLNNHMPSLRCTSLVRIWQICIPLNSPTNGIQAIAFSNLYLAGHMRCSVGMLRNNDVLKSLFNSSVL